MSILKRLGFASPEQVREALYAANVAAANAPLPKGIESDGSPVGTPFNYKVGTLPSSLRQESAAYRTPKYSPKY